MGTYEQAFRKIKVRDRIVVGNDFQVQQQNTPITLSELEVSQRIAHTEPFRKKPGIVSALDSASGSGAAAINTDFMVSGTNMTTALSVLNASGGVVLTTAGAAADQCILSQHTATGTNLNTVQWLTNKKLRFATKVAFGSVTYLTAVAGVKLTAVVDVTTDATGAQFYMTGTTTGGVLQAVYNIAGTDVYAGSSTSLAAGTEYELAIEIDADRVPKFYVDGTYYAKGTALTTATNLKPMIGITSGTAEARDVTIRYLTVSRDL